MHSVTAESRVGRIRARPLVATLLICLVALLRSFPCAAATPQVAGGLFYSVALADDGGVWAWGANGKGQLGIGNKQDQASPVRIAGLPSIKAVAAGKTHTLALASDGTVWAWGANDCGQLGTGGVEESLTPVRVSELTAVRSVAAGLDFSLALREDGTVWAWGTNALGELGIGSTEEQWTPVPISGVARIRALVPMREMPLTASPWTRTVRCGGGGGMPSGRWGSPREWTRTRLCRLSDSVTRPPW